MKKYLVFMIFAFAGASSLQAHELGFILGSATGISAKFNLPEANRSIDMALAYKMNSTSSITLHADYLFDNARSLQIKDINPLAVYYGLGARLVNVNSDGVNKGKTSFGPRAPIGLEYVIHNPNLTFFAEVAVIVDIVPETLVELGAGIGIRYRF